MDMHRHHCQYPYSRLLSVSLVLKMIIIASFAQTISASSVALNSEWRSLEAARRVVDTYIDPECTLLSSHNSLHVKAPKQGLDTSSSAVVTAQLKNRSMLLCQQEVLGSSGYVLPSTHGQYAMVTSADRVEYLEHFELIGFSSLSRWTVLQSKFAYAKARQLPMFLILGRLDTLQLNHTSPTCPELTTKHNGLKSIGMLALLLSKPELAGAVYTDVDASVEDFSPLPSDYMSLSTSGQADVVGTSNWRNPVLINGGALIIRNSQRGREILALWWAYRCGRRDQQGLSRAVFEQWPGWEPSPEHDEFWSKVYPGDLAHLALHHHEIRMKAGFKTQWTCDGVCDWLYRTTGCLKEPLEMPGLLLLPPLPLNDSAHKLVALQHYSGLVYRDAISQWICHTDNQGARACNPKPEVLNKTTASLQAKRRKRLCSHCKQAVQQLQQRVCLKEKGKTSVYACTCDRMLLPEYTLIANESKVIAVCRGCPNEADARHEILVPSGRIKPHKAESKKKLQKLKAKAKAQKKLMKANALKKMSQAVRGAKEPRLNRIKSKHD